MGGRLPIGSSLRVPEGNLHPHGRTGVVASNLEVSAEVFGAVSHPAQALAVQRRWPSIGSKPWLTARQLAD
jgi:hypothetical protein